MLILGGVLVAPPVLALGCSGWGCAGLAGGAFLGLKSSGTTSLNFGQALNARASAKAQSSAHARLSALAEPTLLFLPNAFAALAIPCAFLAISSSCGISD